MSVIKNRNINDNREIVSCIEYVRARCKSDAENGKIRRAFVITFGCQQNEADSEKLRGLARDMGYADAESEEEADLLLINTCAIREHAELKALSVVGNCKHLKAKKPDLIVGVCGCMSARLTRVQSLRRSYPYVSFTLEPSSLHLLPNKVCGVLRDSRRQFQTEVCEDGTVEGISSVRSCRHRAWVSIMYGCNNFCSYCVVPYVRGRERSRNSEDILSEVRGLVTDGCRDITLLGQNVNSYRGDCDFATLIEQVASLPGDFTVRFMTSHPKDVSDDLIRTMAKNTKIARHFHLPVQSGSDKILKRMNRHYDLRHYLEIVAKLRQAIPDISLTSDIIVGFPGETDHDFEQTMELLNKVRFDMVYSFIYSPRESTPAAELPDKVSPEISGARMTRLLEFQRQISLEQNLPLLGKTLPVIIDGISKEDPDMYSGRSETGKLVHLKADEYDIGEIRQILIERVEAFTLYGKKI